MHPKKIDSNNFEEHRSEIGRIPDIIVHFVLPYPPLYAPSASLPRNGPPVWYPVAAAFATPTPDIAPRRGLTP